MSTDSDAVSTKGLEMGEACQIPVVSKSVEEALVAVVEQVPVTTTVGIFARIILTDEVEACEEIGEWTAVLPEADFLMSSVHCHREAVPAKFC